MTTWVRQSGKRNGSGHCDSSAGIDSFEFGRDDAKTVLLGRDEITCSRAEQFTTELGNAGVFAAFRISCRDCGTRCRATSAIKRSVIWSHRSSSVRSGSSSVLLAVVISHRTPAKRRVGSTPDECPTVRSRISRRRHVDLDEFAVRYGSQSSRMTPSSCIHRRRAQELRLDVPGTKPLRPLSGRSYRGGRFQVGGSCDDGAHIVTMGCGA